MTQAEINARMKPWGDRDFSRFAFRQPLLVRCGPTEQQADKQADRLALRDQIGDDRRMRLECAHLGSQTHCKKGIAVVHVMQRCPRFNFKAPQ